MFVDSIKANLYQSSGNALTNFAEKFPAIQGKLAQEIVKDTCELDNLAMNMQLDLDKEKHMENAKAQEQTEPERAEAERVEAEVVYSPVVAELQEYQYNADAFEARGADEVKREVAHKEVSKVREDKAR